MNALARRLQAVRSLPAATVFLLTLPALIPLARADFFVSDDGAFHIYRIAALTEAWRQGVLYPRLFPEFGFGYGQAVLNFYAPLAYYPGALFASLGFDPATATELTIALGFILAALAAFGFVRSLWGPQAACWPRSPIPTSRITWPTPMCAARSRSISPSSGRR